MRVEEVECPIDEEIASIDAKEVRSPGVHCGQIISLIEKQQGRLKGRTDIDDNPDKWKPYRVFGFLFEWVLKVVVFQRLGLVKVGEMCLDGIYMTPDFLDPQTWTLHEFKCTWRSWTGDLNDFWSYLTQIKAYCKAMGILQARLTILFVNGNYKPRVPQLKSFLITFEQYELDENWAMLRNWSRELELSLIHISEPTRLLSISYAVFCLK